MSSLARLNDAIEDSPLAKDEIEFEEIENGRYGAWSPTIDCIQRLSKMAWEDVDDPKLLKQNEQLRKERDQLQDELKNLLHFLQVDVPQDASTEDLSTLCDKFYNL